VVERSSIGSDPLRSAEVGKSSGESSRLRCSPIVRYASPLVGQSRRDESSTRGRAVNDGVNRELAIS
jgi:hypothetical protein